MFIKYLVDKNIISKQQLIEAMAEQMESMPSLLRLISESSTLEADQVYDYLLEGLGQEKSLLEIIREKEALSDEQLFSLIQKQNDSSLSLGDILINKGALERSQYDQVLRDYAAEKPNLSKEAPQKSGEAVKEEKTSEPQKPAAAPAISAAALESLKAVQGLDGSAISELEGQVEQAGPEEESAPEPAPESEKPAAPAISAAALESLKAVQGLDDSAISELEEKVAKPQTEPESQSEAPGKPDMDSPILGEYLESYDYSFQSNLYVVANRYRLKGKEKDLEELYTSFMKLLSLAKLNNFSFQVKLLEPFENIMGLILNGVCDPQEGWQEQPVEALEILWEFRKVIADGKAEGALLAKDDWKSKYLNSLKTVMTYLKKSA